MVGHTFRYPYNPQIASQAREPTTARMKGVLLAGRVFIACRITPTVSRSSLAGGVDAIVGFRSPSFIGDEGGKAGRNSGAGSPEAALGFRNGDGAADFADAIGGISVAFSAAEMSSSPRFSALSIADIAAEIGSVAEFCFAMMSRLVCLASIV